MRKPNSNMVNKMQRLVGKLTNIFDCKSIALLCALGLSVLSAEVFAAAPVAVDDVDATDEDTAFSVISAAGLVSNDTDIDPATTLVVSAVAGGTVGPQFALPSGALATISADGSFSYDPNNAFEDEDNGDSINDTFTYTVFDGVATDTGLIIITISGVNDAPVITSNGGGATFATSASENQATVTNVFADDIDGDDGSTGVALAYDLDGGGGADSAFFSIGAVDGVLIFVASPDFETQADADADGVYEVTVRATDDEGATDTQLINVTVVDINEAPTDIAMDDTTIDEDAAGVTLVGNLTSSDFDTVDTHTYTLVAGTGSANNGSFQINGATLESKAGLALNFEIVSSYSVRIRTTDSGSGNLSFEEAFTISVNNINETPLVAVPASSLISRVPVTEDVFEPITGISVTDVDADLGAGVFVVFTLTEDAPSVGDSVMRVASGPYTGISAAGGSLRIPTAGTGSIADINASIGNLELKSSANYNGEASINVLVNDDGNTSTNGDPALSDNKNIYIEVIEENDDPEVSNIGNQSVDEDQVISGIAFTVDEGAPGNATENIQVLTITATSSDTDLVPDANITVNYADNGAADAGLLAPTIDITPTADEYGTVTITVTVTDDGAGTLSVVDTFDLVINPINDAPVITFPGGQTIDEDVQTGITGLSIVDVDADDGAGLSVVLGVSNGTLNVTSAGTPTIGGNNTGTITISGDVGSVSATISSLLYTSNADFNGADTLTIDADDLGNSGAGGSLTDSETVSITVSAVNDDPVLNVPGSPEVPDEETQTAITGISMIDVDSGASSVTLTLDVASGVINLTASGAAIVSNNNSATVTVTGTITDVSNTAGTLSYTGDLDFNGIDTLTITINDEGSTGAGGGADIVDTVTVSVQAINDAPILIVAGAQTPIEEVQTAITGISVSDVDADSGAGPEFLTMTLDATVGIIDVVASGAAVVTNNSSASVTIEGLVADVSATAASLLYTGSVDEEGTDTLTIVVSDNGNTGVGGVLSDSNTIAIDILAKNDPPVIGDLSLLDEIGTAEVIDISMEEHSTINIAAVLATDVEGDALFYRITNSTAADDVGGQNVRPANGDSRGFFEITGAGDLTWTQEGSGPEDLEHGTPDCDAYAGTDSPYYLFDQYQSDDGDCTFEIEITVWDYDEGVDAAPTGLDAIDGNSDTQKFSITVTDSNDAPGKWVCETFTAGVSDETPSLNQFKYVNGVDGSNGVYLTFAEDNPLTTAREDCHRLFTNSIPLHEIKEGQVLNGVARSTLIGSLSAETSATKFVDPIFYSGGVQENLDQDHYNGQAPNAIDLDASTETMYFSVVSPPTTNLGALVQMKDLSGNTSAVIEQSGGFVYQPPASGVTVDVNGISQLPPDFFLYRVCDDAAATVEETNCAVGIIEVNVVEQPPVAVDSQDAVTFIEELSQTPLELPVPAIPNVMVLFDDTADGMQSDLLTDADILIEPIQESSEGKYNYDGDTKTWIMPYFGDNRNNYLADELTDPGSGLWRLRNSDYNFIYYNPTITYNPWVGLDSDGIEYLDSPPNAAPDNPYDVGGTYDLEGTHSLGGGGGGAGKGGGGGGGGGGITLNYYYTWVDTATNPGYVDIAEIGTKVDIIDDDGSTYTGGADRTDCLTEADAPLVCSGPEEMQNFANWYTFYRSRGLVAKGGLGAVIAAHDDLRVGFAEFNGQSNVIGVDELNESELTGHKADVLEKLYATGDSSGSNNMRSALQRTGNYFECASQAIVNEAQNKNPGDAGCPVLGAPTGNCQHNFALVVSAGFWGGPDPGIEADNDNSSEFDGGKFASSDGDTLADIAMYFYERDLHPDLDDEVPTGQRDFDGVLEANWSTAFGGADGLVETMHQNMRTYIIAFGAVGDVTFDYAESYDVATAFLDSDGNPWAEPVVGGNSKLDDLVHAAINGRGLYLNAGNPVELNSALEQAFNEFSTFVGTATAVSSNAEEILVGSVIYRASYNVSDGTGQLVAQEISLNELGVVALGDETWSAAEELDSVDSDDRVIITYDPILLKGVPFRYENLTIDQVGELADAEVCTPVTGLEDPTTFCSAGFITEVTNHIDWFRGDATNERPNGNLRERPEVEGRIGDIVNSTPTFYGEPNRSRRNGVTFPQTATYTYAEFSTTYADRQGIVYLSANDGMLHAFNSDTGKEEFAYIPDAVLRGSYNNKAKGLLDFNYSHEYVNDLSPTLEDVFIDTVTSSGSPASAVDRNWATILIGGLAAGGKGYYALDITNPVPNPPTGLTEAAASIADMALWEFTDEDDTYPVCERPTADSCNSGEGLIDGAGDQLIDTSISPTQAVRDLGFSISLPTIAMSNLETDGEQEWVAMFGNGYNSSSGRAKLYVLRIEAGVDGDWCHGDHVFDGNSDLGDAWDHTTANPPCTGGNDFIKIEAAGPILTLDVDLDGVYDVGVDQISANGLGSPRGIDIDRNGTLDYAYAGDRFGNLYRFDLTSTDQTEWTAEVIFQAKYIESTIDVNGDLDTVDEILQPITTRPFVVQHPTASAGVDCDPDPVDITVCGGFIVIFGTGSYVYEGDGTNEEVQSIYGIWERFQSGASNLITKDQLVRQQYTFTDASHLFRQLSSNAVDYTLQGDGSSPDRGYYIDFDTPAFTDPTSIPFQGERAIRNVQGFAGVVFVNSIIPKTATSCTSEAGGAENAFCPDTGGLECTGGAPIFDVNNDGIFDSNDLVDGTTVPASMIIEDGVPTDSTFIGRSRLTQLSDQSFQATLVNPATTDSTGRLSWKLLESTTN